MNFTMTRTTFALFFSLTLFVANNALAQEDYSTLEENNSVAEEATSVAPVTHKVEIDPAFGYAFTNPQEINNSTSAENKLGSMTYWGIAGTYRIRPDIGIGLGFNRLSASKTTEDTTTSFLPGMSRISASGNLLTVEGRYTFYRSSDRRWEAVAAPAVGIGFFSNSYDVGLLGGPSVTITSASASGLVLGATVGARYWILPNLAAGLFTGYRYARSGELTIDDVGIATLAPDIAGTKLLDPNGNPVRVNLSSFVIATQITWAI